MRILELNTWFVTWVDEDTWTLDMIWWLLPSQPKELMNSHCLGEWTPQDWRKRPEAEVKLPRDPTEAPTIWDDCFFAYKWGVVLRICHYKNLECTYIVYIYIYYCQLVWIRHIRHSCFYHILRNDWKDLSFADPLGDWSTRTKCFTCNLANKRCSSPVVCQRQVKLTSVF